MGDPDVMADLEAYLATIEMGPREEPPRLFDTVAEAHREGYIVEPIARQKLGFGSNGTTRDVAFRAYVLGYLDLRGVRDVGNVYKPKGDATWKSVRILMALVNT